MFGPTYPSGLPPAPFLSLPDAVPPPSFAAPKKDSGEESWSIDPRAYRAEGLTCQPNPTLFRFLFAHGRERERESEHEYQRGRGRGRGRLISTGYLLTSETFSLTHHSSGMSWQAGSLLPQPSHWFQVCTVRLPCPASYHLATRSVSASRLAIWQLPREL